MIDLAEIIDRIQKRAQELGTSVTAISKKATGSEDTIRNWIRLLQTDPGKASATTIKLNQIEEAIGVELAVNAASDSVSGEAEIKRLLRRIKGLPPEAINPVWRLIGGYLEDAESHEQNQPHDQSESASRHREGQPSR